MERRAAAFGDEQWAAVANGVSGRSAADCRVAWRRSLAAERGPWTEAEDAAIIQSVDEGKNVRHLSQKREIGRLCSILRKHGVPDGLVHGWLCTLPLAPAEDFPCIIYIPRPGGWNDIFDRFLCGLLERLSDELSEVAMHWL